MCLCASGGLEAPDPNRPFQSRPQPSRPPLPPANTPQPSHGTVTPGEQAVAPLQRSALGSSQQAERKQGRATVITAVPSRASHDRGSNQSTAANKHDTPQGRVLAKLGLSKGGQHNSSGSTRTALPQPTAPVSGESGV